MGTLADNRILFLGGGTTDSEFKEYFKPCIVKIAGDHEGADINGDWNNTDFWTEITYFNPSAIVIDRGSESWLDLKVAHRIRDYTFEKNVILIFALSPSRLGHFSPSLNYTDLVNEKLQRSYAVRACTNDKKLLESQLLFMFYSEEALIRENMIWLTEEQLNEELVCTLQMYKRPQLIDLLVEARLKFYSEEVLIREEIDKLTDIQIRDELVRMLQQYDRLQLIDMLVKARLKPTDEYPTVGEILIHFYFLKRSIMNPHSTTDMRAGDWEELKHAFEALGSLEDNFMKATKILLELVCPCAK